MAVDDVEVGGVEAVEGARDRGADPGGGVVEGVCGDAADLCEQVVGAAVVGGGGEGGGEEELGGAVVGGGVEGGDAGGEGAVDDCGRGERVGGVVVLVVEGCGAEDEGGED